LPDRRRLHYTRSLSKVFRIRLADFVSVFSLRSAKYYCRRAAGNSDDIIKRFYYTSGEDRKAVISLFEAFKSLEETFRIENGTKIFVQDKTIEMPISKHEIKTLRMIMQAWIKHKLQSSIDIEKSES
jgi:hypothetical protein